MIRVLLADDQALVRGGFRSILEGQDDIEVTGEAADGLEVIDQAMASRPDVIVMDIRMPRMDGIEATQRLVSDVRVRARVMMLTTFDHDEYVYEALRAGASGFLLKIADYVRRPRPGASPPPGLATLTSRELEVLGLIAQGLSNAEIGAALFLSEPTIKTHVTRILAKLQLRDRVQAVVLAYESGLVQPGAR